MDSKVKRVIELIMILKNLSPVMSLVFGILILLNPKLLSTLIGIYLIVTALIGFGILRF